MAQRNLLAAADAGERHPARPRGWASTREELGSGARLAAAMYIPYDDRLAFTLSRRASPITRSGTSPPPSPDEYPLLLHFPYFDLYRKQVVKQADLVLAM